jgi:hypothetical protein
MYGPDPYQQFSMVQPSGTFSGSGGGMGTAAGIAGMMSSFLQPLLNFGIGMHAINKGVALPGTTPQQQQQAQPQQRTDGQQQQASGGMSPLVIGLIVAVIVVIIIAIIVALKK